MASTRPFLIAANHPGHEPYSFIESSSSYLRERGLTRVVIAGLATDYCVGFSALDAARLGFDTHLVLDSCRGIDMDGLMDAMLGKMRQAGVTITDSDLL